MTVTQVDYAAVFAKADEAGKAAARACVPTPMIVSQHANVLNDSSPVTKAWYVPEGVCGYAYVTIRPGTSPLARYAKKFHGGRKGYYGGTQIWVHGSLDRELDFGQSYEVKVAYAQAFAQSLSEQTGEKVYAGGDLD